ncbi:MAG: fused MFS/spermidine synthase [Candidatus Eisenbacteria bacterium]|nr:fused MFS/spermidine synthase [Candidatus Eisenbacteria bacterium]
MKGVVFGRGELPRWMHPALVVVFTLSGASALAYQVLWTRQLGFVLGGSAVAVSTVLAVFFAGLGLGSFLGGRIADRLHNPLAAYGVAELTIAAAALATPFLLSASGAVYLGLYRALGDAPGLVLFGRVLATTVILIVPTTMMGATLPLISRFYVRRVDRLGRGLGLLYGVNTLGGMIGAGIVGYVSILEFGVRNSFYLAVAANVLAAFTALLLSRGHGLVEGDTEAAGPGDAAVSGGRTKETGRATRSDSGLGANDPGLLRLCSLGFFISGFTSIAYEVLWTRALNFAIGNSVYAFTTILVVFLAGLVPGAFLAGRLADRTRSPFRALAIVQLLTSASVLLLFSQAGKLPGLSVYLFSKLGAGTLGTDILTKVLPAGVALFVPALIIGLTFPLILKVVTDRIEWLGRRVGTFYAINTLGGILGSVTAGFVLLPSVGLSRGIILVAAINALMGGLFLRRAESASARRIALPVGLVLMLVLVVVAITIRPVPFIRYTTLGRGDDVEILYHEEGHTATVAVTERPSDSGKDRFLWINLLGASVTDAEYHHQQYYTLIALYPAALHPSPTKVFVAGLASGVTAGAAALDARTESVTCVEISPEVIRAADLFSYYNFDVMDDPKVSVLADDARAYLGTTEDRYDVLITDVFISAVTGTSALYSREYFELCLSRLAPGGIMSVGGGALRDTDQTVARTFAEVFPYVAVFVVDDRSAYNRTFLIGSREPLDFRRSSIDAACSQPRVAAEWYRYGVGGSSELISTYLCDRETALEFLAKAAVCTDDLPIIDFGSVAWAEGFLPTRETRGGPGLQMLLRRAGGTRAIPFLKP